MIGNTGLAVLAGFVAGFLSALALLDAWFAITGRRSLGARVTAWAGRYPLYSLALIAFFGALLGHLFLHVGI